MRMAKRMAIGLTAIVGGVAPLVPAVPASAAAHVATAMVSTQRMSGPSLNSTQHGWYAKGSRLALSCFTRGQAVQGFYSKYLPGGWDNLWYKVSDNYFVADVDIDTGSDNPVTAACPTGRISTATFVSRTRGKTVANAQGTYPGECVSLVSQFLLQVKGIRTGAWGNAIDYRSGGTGGRQLQSRGLRWHTDRHFADGDLIVWQASATAGTGAAGHVGIWYGGKVFDQNDGRHSPARTANYSAFFPGGYLGYWRS